jgi:hypothetical protein
MSAPARGRAARGGRRPARARGGDPTSNGYRSLQAQAEVLKLARLLHREPGSLAYLEQLSLDDLGALRDQVTEVLFSANRRTLARLAGTSKVLPAGVVATIAQRAFGPVLAASIASLLEPSRAVDVAAKLPPAFLADVAIELDPRRATDVIAQIPPAQVADVTRELVARGEYVTMGRFVGHLPDESVAAALGELDDRALLRVGFVLDQKKRIDHVVGLLDPGRYAGLIDAAEDDLWPQALDLLSHLGKARRRELAELAIDRGAPVLESLVQAAEQHDMWDAVLRLESVISASSRERFVAFVEEHHPELRPRLESGGRA